MIRSESFETQEVREIDRKKAGESIAFPILWMGIIENVFQMEGNECRDQERLKVRGRRKFKQEKGRCFGMGWATLSGPVAVDEDRFEASKRNLAGEEKEQEDE